MSDNRSSFAVPWGAKDCAKLIFLAIVFITVSIVLFEIAVHAAGQSSGEGSSASPVAEFGGQIIFYSAFLAACWVYFKRKRYKITFATLGFRRTPLAKAFLWTVLIYFLDLIGTVIWVRLVKSEPLPVKKDYGSSILGFVLAFAGIAVLAPVVEELFFRGILFQGFSKRLGLIGGGCASAAVFMIFHVDPRVYGRIFISGALFAFLYYRTRSLWPSIVCHSVANSLAVISLFMS
ncbi:MAG: CPBP family intramembrane glutamic endopeptidase [Thermoleophilia bacterium]